MPECNCGFQNGHPHTKELHQANGRRNVESGLLAKICAKGGRVGGRKNVESGHLKRINQLPQTKAAHQETGYKAARSGRLASIASKGGQAAVRLGYVAKLNELPQTKVAQRINGRIQGRKNVESGLLAKARESQKNPSNEEIERLHKRLLGWQYDIFVDPYDGGNKIQVDAFRGRVCVFYDGIGGRHHLPEFQERDRRQSGRLERAGYYVRRIFNRTPTDVEVLQWNILADTDNKPLNTAEALVVS